MAPHEPCPTCRSTAGCACSELAVDLRKVAPHHPGPPTPPHATPAAHRLVYQLPKPFPASSYVGADLARLYHARGPQCSACLEGWPVRCVCGGHIHCGPAPQKPICERSPGGGCDQPTPMTGEES